MEDRAETTYRDGHAARCPILERPGDAGFPRSLRQPGHPIGDRAGIPVLSFGRGVHGASYADAARHPGRRASARSCSPGVPPSCSGGRHRKARDLPACRPHKLIRQARRSVSSAAFQAAPGWIFRLHPRAMPWAKSERPFGPQADLTPEKGIQGWSYRAPEESSAFRAEGPGSLSPAQRAGFRSVQSHLPSPTGAR